MRQLKKPLRFLSLSSLALLTACSGLSLMKTENIISCTDLPSGEFSQAYEAHNYLINLSPGDELSVTINVIGDYLETALELFEPAQDRIINQTLKQKEASFQTGILSGRGEYRIKVRNYSTYQDDRIRLTEQGRAGVYSMTLRCTKA